MAEEAFGHSLMKQKQKQAASIHIDYVALPS